MLRTAAILTLLATPLSANPIAEILCAPSKQMQQKLEQQFRSARAASGMRSPEQMMEVWTDQRGDWAMVVRYASGTSCIVAMGEHWEETKNPT
ncbi:hypothetical protein [Tateyamaria omphalii]|uniref:Uncharacterized protein n=1 Tax=Tateyamaria omphalii TaxID=299262 RepID=A0A1P8MSI8_9RHOB|nr:hypothetical protein [Tateyamaria omphalii]APX11021.1 hypothetical protein BWR18_04445 [Tateyamaria omphalii]